MANYGYETLQQMSAHPWEGLKPAQRKAVRRLEQEGGRARTGHARGGTPPGDESEHEHGRGAVESHEPAYKAASADTKERIAELRKATKTESKPAKTAKTPSAKKDVAELVGEALNPKPADGVTGPDWQWLDQLPVDHAPVPSQGVYIALATAMRVNPGMWTRMRAYVRSDWKRGRQAARALVNRVNIRRHPVDAPEGLLRGRVPHLGGWLLGLLRTLRGTG